LSETASRVRQGLWHWRWTPAFILPVGLPWVLDTINSLSPIDINPRYLLILAATCVAFASLALGLNVAVGYTGLLNLGYIAFFAVGNYTYAILSSDQLHQHWPSALVLLVAVAVASILAFCLGLASIRLRGDYLAIITLGFGEIMRIFLLNLDRPINITGGVSGILNLDPIQLVNLKLFSDAQYYFLFLSFCYLFIFVLHRWVNSRIGRAWMAIRDDELAGYQRFSFSGRRLRGRSGHRERYRSRLCRVARLRVPLQFHD
jgi:branched-chain amino acid transport system permease protein